MSNRAQSITDYREVRLAFAYDISGITADRFNALVLDALGSGEHAPCDFVSAAKGLTFKCSRCAGTGAFITYVENGIPKGPGGECFRCQGKGYQTLKDAKRNAYHDAHFCPRI
jgi:hypothetical protein